MSAVTTSFPNTAAGWQLPSRGKVAMAGLIIAESAIFTIFVVAYLFYLGKRITGPTPGEVSGTRHWICIPWILAAHHCAWWIVPLWHSRGMAPTDLRTRADDLDQS